MPEHSQLPWHDPSWMKQAHAWIHAETARRSIPVTGDIEQPHLYPWSTVLHVPTKDGTLFFKATALETIYEAELTQKLAFWYPDCMPELIAVDTARGWMLTRHGGEQLRASIRPTGEVRLWEPVIRRYAEVQIGLSEHVPEILALGIPDHRLEKLPDLYSELLAREDSLLIDQPKGLASAEVHQLQRMVPRFRQLCDELAGYGIHETLNQCDFHDGNILIKEGRITFFDWGDVSVTHPFVSLRTFFVSIEISLNLEDYSFTPDMEALLNVYLEPWQKFALKEELLKAYRLSKPVASIVKALLWYEGISRMDDSVRAEYAWIVPSLWQEFIHLEKMLAS